MNVFDKIQQITRGSAAGFHKYAETGRFDVAETVLVNGVKAFCATVFDILG